MTDIERKALALITKCVGSAIWEHPITRINRQTNIEHEALCRAIEQHEAFRQEVSDALLRDGVFPQGQRLSRFIIPDPLVEVLKALPVGRVSLETYARNVRAALEARGLEIREKNYG